MIEFSNPEEAQLTIKEQLIDTIKKLSEEQQEYLLDAINEWVKDRREYPRLDCCKEVIYSDNNRVASGSTQNISASGVFVEPAGPFSVGQEIIMTMEHPAGGKQIKINGEIVRKEKGGIGISFEKQIKGII